MKFIPKIYQKDVLSVPYNKLKENGVKCLLFDLDNTLCGNQNSKVDKLIVKKIKKLKKEFKVYIVSNSILIWRVKKIANMLDVPCYYLAMKPSRRIYRKIIRENGYQLNEIVMIGDQMLTDVFVANRLGITSILVDPINGFDIGFTEINRLIEKIIFKKYSDKIKKGEYYE